MLENNQDATIKPMYLADKADPETQKLAKRIRRFSFESKMHMIQEKSFSLWKRMMNSIPEEIRRYELPEELEALAKFSVLCGEWNGNQVCFGEKDYTSFINFIRKKSDFLISDLDGEDYLNHLFPSLSARQFWWQENIFFHFYRFRSYFGMQTAVLDMPEEFYDYFGFQYQDAIRLTIDLFSFMDMMHRSADFEQNKRQFDKIISKYRNAFSALCRSRTEIIEIADQFASSESDCYSCLSPFALYPFIEYEDSFYFPIIHDLVLAITDSLMFRIHTERPSVKTNMNTVYEQFLFQIVKGSDLFDEVVREYTYDRGQKKTLDVLARKGGSYLLLDSKSYTPKASLRIYDDNALKNDIGRISEGIAQVYKHIRYRFGSEYNPFNTEINRDHVFGILALQTDSYIQRNILYRKAAEMAEIPVHSPEFTWMRHHVLISDMRVLEKTLFTSSDILDQCEKTSEEGYVFLSPSKTEVTYQPYLDFIHEINRFAREEII